VDRRRHCTDQSPDAPSAKNDRRQKRRGLCRPCPLVFLDTRRLVPRHDHALSPIWCPNPHRMLGPEALRGLASPREVAWEAFFVVILHVSEWERLNSVPSQHLGPNNGGLVTSLPCYPRYGAERTGGEVSPLSRHAMTATRCCPRPVGTAGRRALREPWGRPKGGPSWRGRPGQDSQGRRRRPWG
jgi:hypothetical protein